MVASVPRACPARSHRFCIFSYSGSVGGSLFQRDDARIRNSKDAPTIRHDAVCVVTASHDWKCPVPILRLHRFIVRSGRKHGHSDLFDDDAVAPSSEAAARTTSACCASGSGMSSRAPGLSRRTIHDGGKEPLRPGRDCSQRLAHSLSSYLSTCRRSCPIIEISGCFLATFKRGRVKWTLVLAHRTLAPRFSMNSSMVSLWSPKDQSASTLGSGVVGGGIIR